MAEFSIQEALKDTTFNSDDQVFKLPRHTVTEVMTTLSQTKDWGVQQFNIPTLWKDSYGEGVVVGVADTGGLPDHPDLEGAYKDIADFTNSRSGPIDIQGHGCTHPSTVVYTSMCGTQTIEEVFDRSPGVAYFQDDGTIIKDMTRYNVNTVSLNKDGETVRGRISHVHKIPYKGVLHRVKTRQGEVRLTPWHPTFMLKSSTGTKKRVEKIRADQVKVGNRFFLSGYCNGVTDHKLSIPFGDEQFELNEDLAYLAGLVMSDGHLMKRQKSIEFTNTNSLIVEQFETLCEKIFGKFCGNYKQQKNQPKSIRRRLDSVRAYTVLNSIGVPSGNKSKTKEFPEAIAKSPLSVIGAFIAGYIEGNGSVGTENRMRVITGSKRFAEGLMILLKSLGSYCSDSLGKCGFKGYEDSKTYVVRVGRENWIGEQLRVKKWDTSKGKNRVAANVTEVTTEHFDGFLYDFTVDFHHNYVANGHIVSNTHVAGIIGARHNNVGMVGVAPKCQMLSAKVLGDNGSGSGKMVADGVRWMVDNGADIINMSLGSGHPDRMIYEAIQYAVQNRVLVVCAAGNDGNRGVDTINYPAKFPGTVSVGSIDKNRQISRFSSRGEMVDIVAPGGEILSTYPPQTYAKLSGTSMATPFVCGVIALMVAQRRAFGKGDTLDEQHELKQVLRDSAIDAGDVGKDRDYGYGLINPEELLRMGEELKPQPAPQPTPSPQPAPDGKALSLSLADFTEEGLKKLREFYDSRGYDRGELDNGGDVVLKL